MSAANDKKLICLCNAISKQTIEKAVAEGASTLDEIYDRTQAGVGGCGGSCRPKLKFILDFYLKNHRFPEKIPKRL